MAVREAASALGGPALLLKSQASFVVHIFKQLDNWADMYHTVAWELSLTLAREANADIVAAFELAGKRYLLPQSYNCMYHTFSVLKSGCNVYVPTFWLVQSEPVCDVGFVQRRTFVCMNMLNFGRKVRMCLWRL